MSSSQNTSGTLSTMQAGDVLVSHPSSVLEHDVSIVPDKPHTTTATRDEAIAEGVSEAEARGVDGWVTEDQIHVVKVAAHRQEGE